jgi:hypothetical protein
LAIIIVFLLLVVDWLAFHDIFEPHTLRDWLTLVSSILVFFYIAASFSKRTQAS